jgi:hypothetical protein
MLRRVALVGTDVSEERSSSITRVTGIGEIGTILSVPSNRRAGKKYFVRKEALKWHTRMRAGGSSLLAWHLGEKLQGQTTKRVELLGIAARNSTIYETRKTDIFLGCTWANFEHYSQ